MKEPRHNVWRFLFVAIFKFLSFAFRMKSCLLCELSDLGDSVSGDPCNELYSNEFQHAYFRVCLRLGFPWRQFLFL